MGMVLAYFAAARRWGILVTISIGLLGAYAGALVLRIFGGLTVHEPPTVGLLTETAAGIVRVWKDMLTLEPRFGLDSAMVLARSEERRVGEEWRCGGMRGEAR